MNVSELNQNNWGVCGFIAAVQAAVKNKKTGVALAANTYDTLFPLIENFCNRHGNLSAELLNFSAVFGQAYAYSSLNQVLGQMRGNHAMDAQVGLAMTAASVSQLCKDLGFTNADFHGTTATTNTLNPSQFPYKNAICGIGKAGSGNFRYGLLHWVYVDENGSPYTWGSSGKAAADALTQQGYNKLTHYLPGLS